jgi:hypothetical protein
MSVARRSLQSLKPLPRTLLRRLSSPHRLPQTLQPSALLPPQEGYASVGFEQLSGYQIEISDELLGPQTNKTVLTADGQIPEPIKG